MKNIRIALFSGTVLLALPALPAEAADAVSYENPFAGFYMGVHAGYGWSGSDEHYEADLGVQAIGVAQNDLISGPKWLGDLSGDFSVDGDGPLIGAQAGANFIMSNGLLLGVEVSGSWSGMKGDKSFSVSDPSGSPIPLDVDVENHISALGFAQAKLGWANETFAVYGMGGLAMTRFQRDLSVKGGEGAVCTELDPCPIFAAQFDPRFSSTSGGSDLDEVLPGWTLGAGLDLMVADNVSLGVAYNYARFEYDDSFELDTSAKIDFGRISGSSSTEVETSGHLDVHVVKATLNYHF